MNGEYTEMRGQKEKTRKSSIVQLVSVLLIGVIVMIGCEKTESGVPDCVISNHINEEYYLTIIANQKEIEDKEAFAKKLIEQVCSNSFKTIMFSFEETGYPTNLDMTVYLSEKDWQSHNEPYMNVSFKQESILDGCNIVEHYDKFHLKIN